MSHKNRLNLSFHFFRENRMTRKTRRSPTSISACISVPLQLAYNPPCLAITALTPHKRGYFVFRNEPDLLSVSNVVHADRAFGDMWVELTLAEVMAKAVSNLSHGTHPPRLSSGHSGRMCGCTDRSTAQTGCTAG